jgi:predicted DNA-binding transcriptional regulator AlpA
MATETTTPPDAPPAKVERLIYTDEVAARYGVHPKTLLRFIDEGKVPAPLKAKFGNGLCWRESVIDEHLRSLQ